MTEAGLDQNSVLHQNKLKTPNLGTLLLLAIAIAFVGALLFPIAAFSIDEAIYVDMAHAMAANGSLHVTPENYPADTPLMGKWDEMVRIVDDRAVPQYPGLYGLIAAPFFLLLGVNGLVLLNALSAIASLWLTYRIALMLFEDDAVAQISVCILGVATIFAGYVFAIWPHMTALAIYLAGAYCTLLAGRQRAALSSNAPIHWACSAGLLIGFGAAIRIDIVLGAIAAIFWLRLFAHPSNRFVAGALSLCLTPGLVIAAWINQLKFGVFTPFTYGAEVESNTVSGNLQPIILFGLLTALLFLFDTTKKPIKPVVETIIRTPISIVLLGAAAALGFVHFVFPGLYRGLWVLLIDLQAFAGPPRPGLERDALGYWDFWGVPKKALAQSMPWIALVLLPISQFLKGRLTKQVSFLLLFLSAVVFFYAIRSWHGGMAYNLRYYLPAAPFLSILAALAMRELQFLKSRHSMPITYPIVFGLTLGIFGYILSPTYGLLSTPIQTYTPLLLTFLLAASIIWVSLKPNDQLAATTAKNLAVSGFAFAALISASDAMGYLADRERNAGFSSAYADITKPGDIIFTQYDDLLLLSSVEGATIIRVEDDNLNDAQTALSAFMRSQRCIYAHTLPAAQLLGEAAFVIVNTPTETIEPGIALYRYKASSENCDIR